MPSAPIRVKKQDKINKSMIEKVEPIEEETNWPSNLPYGCHKSKATYNQTKLSRA